MKLPPRPPGLSREHYRAFLAACSHAEAMHRKMSDERALWRLCPRAQCQRAGRCAEPASRICFREYAKTTGNREIWRTFYTRMVASGSAVLPWRAWLDREEGA